jgi:hypothetical protein
MSSPLSSDSFEMRRAGFETEYFHKQDEKVTEKLRKIFNQKMDRESLRRATGISNDEVIDRLLAVNAKGELLLAFRLYPLVEIAWADGAADQREIKAVVEAATGMGVPAGSAALKALEDWLHRGPTADGRTAWHAFAQELCKTLSPDELAKFRHDLLEGASAVAKASGGILGVGFEVSRAEKKAIDTVAKALHG